MFRGVPAAVAVAEDIIEGGADASDHDDRQQGQLPARELQEKQWAVLSQALQMSGMDDNPRAMIVFEFVFHIVHFCAESGFNFLQMSAVLGIFGDVFSACLLTSSGKLREDAVSMFTERISIHARPSTGGEPLLDVDLVKRSAVFFADTVIKHFDAYQYVMGELPVERVERLQVVVQTPVSTLVMLDEAEGGDDQKVEEDSKRETEDTTNQEI